MPSLINPYAFPPGTMLSAIQRLGLTSNLVLCLDAGDIASYDGSSQTWTDVSGQGNHYYRGTGSGSDARDGTFNGVAGGQSSAEYFSSDGGDLFTPTAAHTFANNWHKDGATFTVAGWVFVPSGVASPPGYPLITTRGTGAVDQHGVSVQIAGLAATGRIALNYANGSSVQAVLPPTQDLITENAWMFVALSFSEGSGASFAQYNETVDVVASDSYSSPSSAAPSTSPTLWQTDTSTPVVAPSGARLRTMPMWSAALSQAQVGSIFSLTRGWYGV